MNARDYIRPIIAGLVGIGLIILVIVLITRIFSGGGGGDIGPRVDVGAYANTQASATLLADDPTQIDQDHRQIKITVSQNQNTIEIIKGYQGTVIDARTYPNNSAAFVAPQSDTS